MSLYVPDQVHDRAPLAVALDYNGSVAPHGSTTRASYTVPAGRHALIRSAHLYISRLAAAGTPGNATIWLVVTGSTVPAASCRLHQPDNGVGASMLVHHAPGIWLPAGATASLLTADGSVTGTVLYNGNIQIVEFGALA